MVPLVTVTIFRFTVNEKQTPSLDTLLYDITRTIKPVFGAVRELYTPYGGTQIEVKMPNF